MQDQILQVDENMLETRLDRLVSEKVEQLLNAMLDAEADEITGAARYERTGDRKAYRAGHYERDLTVKAGTVCFASMFVRQVRQCFSAVWADGFPRCRHRFPVM